MTEKNYHIIQAVYIVALFLMAAAVIYWFLNKERNWSSILLYGGLFLITATNYGIARKNYLSKRK